MGLIAAWGASWEEASELAADVFAEAWLSRERFAGDEEDLDRAGAWLRGIAFRLHAARARSRARTVSFAAVTEEPEVPSAESNPRLELLKDVIEELPDKEREVVLMYYLEEVEIERVAALLETSVRAVEGRLYRARKRLRERMAKPSAQGGEG